MRMSSRFFLLLAGVVVLLPAAAIAQRDNKPLDLPNGPAKPGFDIKRFTNSGNGWFETFYVKETESLQKAPEDGRVASDTRVVVFKTAAGNMSPTKTRGC